MNRQVNISLVMGTLILGFVLGLIGFSANPQGATPVVTSVRSEASYLEVTSDDLIMQADASFVGHIVSISPAQWNQDSGEYWEEEGAATVAYHEIEVTVVQTLVDTIGLAPQITLTVVGNSPTGSRQSPGVAMASDVDHSLQVGDQAIFFVQQGHMAWRGGMRPVISLIGYPRTSYLIRQRDALYHSERPGEAPISLEALITKIRTKR